MRKFVMILAVAGVLVTVVAAPGLYAKEPQGPTPGPGGSMTGPEMQRMMKMMGM